MNRALYGLGFLAAAAYWPGILDAATAPRWAVLAVLVPLCLLLLKPSSSLVGRPLWPAFAAVLVPLAAAISIAWSTGPLNGLDDLVHLAILAGAFYLGSRLDDMSAIWSGAAAGVALSGVIAVLQLAGWDVVPQVVPPSGLFANKNMLAEAAVVGLVVAPSALLFLACAVALAVTTSKAAVGAVAVVGAIMLYPRRPALAVGIFAALVVAVAWAFTSGAVASADIRTGYWLQALAALTPFGHGLGSFVLFNPEAEFAHSELVQLAFELGLLSIPVLALFVYAMGGNHAVVGKQRERLVLAGVAAVALFAFPLHMPFTAFAAALAGGHLVAARLRVRGEQYRRSSTFGYGV